MRQLFIAATVGVVPFWLLLIVAPRARVTERLLHSIWIYVALAGLYAWALASLQGVGPADMLSWEGVRDAHGHDAMIVAGWLHFITLDLFAGAWQARDALRHRISHWWVAPCLWLTFSVAPIGLGAYLIVRSLHTRAARLDDPEASGPLLSASQDKR